MRKILLLICIAALSACVKEDIEQMPGGDAPQVIGDPQGALKGTVAVKLTPEAAALLEKASVETRSGETRSGIDDVDAILERINAASFSRIFPYNEEFEQVHRSNGLHLWYRIYFDQTEDLGAVARMLADDEHIATVEFTYQSVPMRKFPVTPFTAENAVAEPETRAGVTMNDKLFGYQWHYNNTGPTTNFPTRRAGADINLLDAWELCTGDPSIVVAVLDEPVQTTHPDLKDNIWSHPAKPNVHGYNFYDKKAELDWQSYDRVQVAPGQYMYQYADHGTHVAGTIAAVNNNNLGVCGVAGGRNGSGVKIMSCQTMGYSSKQGNPDAAAQAFTFAADNGAVIAQNSWGYVDPTTGNAISESVWNSAGGSIRTAIDYFINNAGSKNTRFPDSPLEGGLVIFSAGNSGYSNKGTKSWPAAYPPVVAVGAMSWDYTPAGYSDYGTWVDITAPGGDLLSAPTPSNPNRYYTNAEVLSTMLQDPTMTFLDGRSDASNAEWFGYGFQEGTSMACPHVSGIAALGLSYAAQIGRRFTVAEFKSLLLGAVYGIENYFTGTKPAFDDAGNIGSISLPDYVGKMGGGEIDAFKLLLDIQGTPALFVRKDTPTTINLSRYFTGAKSVSVSLSAADLTKLGMSAQPTFSATSMSLTCTKRGAAFVTIQATVGDTQVVRKFAIVVRDGMATNGGWL